MKIDMTTFKGRQKPGRDYSTALRDLLPSVIGEKPKSKLEICAEVGRNHSTVTRVMEKVRGQIHIAEWRRGESGPITPLWIWGKGEDAPKPDPLTNSEKSRRYRSTEHGRKVCQIASRRWKKSANGKKRTKETRRAKYLRDRFAAGGIAALLKRDRLMSAIIGAR